MYWKTSSFISISTVKFLTLYSCLNISGTLSDPPLFTAFICVSAAIPNWSYLIDICPPQKCHQMRSFYWSAAEKSPGLYKVSDRITTWSGELFPKVVVVTVWSPAMGLCSAVSWIGSDYWIRTFLNENTIWFSHGLHFPCDLGLYRKQGRPGGGLFRQKSHLLCAS